MIWSYSCHKNLVFFYISYYGIRSWGFIGGKISWHQEVIVDTFDQELRQQLEKDLAERETTHRVNNISIIIIVITISIIIIVIIFIVVMSITSISIILSKNIMTVNRIKLSSYSISPTPRWPSQRTVTVRCSSISTRSMGHTSLRRWPLTMMRRLLLLSMQWLTNQPSISSC